MGISAIFKNGIWVIRAVVAGEIQEFVGKTLPAAAALFYKAKAGEFVV